MRIVYFGTGEFAVPALDAIHKHVVQVVTQPDRPAGRGMQPRPSPVRRRAMSLGLPVVAPERASSQEFVAQLRDLGPDALVVAAYGQILSEDLLATGKRGGINLHGSILPKYRGAAPIQRAILAGETETGVTLMQMDKGMDSGDIIACETTSIGPDETYGELQERLAVIGARMIATWLPNIAAGNYPRRPQDPQQATFAKKIAKSDAELRFERPAAPEYNRFRATTPAPGAFLSIRPRPDSPLLRIRLHRLRLEALSGPPGTILACQPFPIVSFHNGSLRFEEVQPEGKKKMSGRDWANGLRLRPGQVLSHG